MHLLRGVLASKTRGRVLNCRFMENLTQQFKKNIRAPGPCPLPAQRGEGG